MVRYGEADRTTRPNSPHTCLSTIFTDRNNNFYLQSARSLNFECSARNSRAFFKLTRGICLSPIKYSLLLSPNFQIRVTNTSLCDNVDIIQVRHISRHYEPFWSVFALFKWGKTRENVISRFLQGVTRFLCKICFFRSEMARLTYTKNLFRVDAHCRCFLLTFRFFSGFAHPTHSPSAHTLHNV